MLVLCDASSYDLPRFFCIDKFPDKEAETYVFSKRLDDFMNVSFSSFVEL